jgi:hypothetical protein
MSFVEKKTKLVSNMVGFGWIKGFKLETLYTSCGMVNQKLSQELFQCSIT